MSKHHDIVFSDIVVWLVTAILIIALFVDGDLVLASDEIVNYLVVFNNQLVTAREPLVKGQIIFDEAKPLSNATVYVRLEDTTYMDAPSKIVSEQVISNVNFDPASPNRIEFSLYGEVVNTEASYSVSVHIDVDNDRKLSSGDFINMEAAPVLTYDYPDNISVHVKQIK